MIGLLVRCGPFKPSKNIFNCFTVSMLYNRLWVSPTSAKFSISDYYEIFMASQFVYHMNRVGKVVPPKREILKDISLSFFPGAKIGVLGLNGSGKSTLLRIMAGVDKEFNGEARPQADINIGYLPQEPQLDEDADVRGNVEQGLGEIMALLEEFNAISDKFAEPMSDDEMNTLLERQGDLQTKIDAVDGWEVDRILERAADALRLPPWDAKVAAFIWRRETACCSLPASSV